MWQKPNPNVDYMLLPHIRKIYSCKCSCAALEFNDDCFDEKEPILDVCIWRAGSPNSSKRSWWDRFRWCWRMLKSGQMYTDDICLDYNTVQEIIRDLQQWSEEKYKKLMEIEDGK